MGGTVVEEASCQGDQYLSFGHDSTFQMKSDSDLYCVVNNTLVGVSCSEDAANWENMKWPELLKVSARIKQLFVKQADLVYG